MQGKAWGLFMNVFEKQNSNNPSVYLPHSSRPFIQNAKVPQKLNCVNVRSLIRGHSLKIFICKYNFVYL